MTTAYFLVRESDPMTPAAESLVATGRPHQDSMAITSGLVATGLTKCASKCIAESLCNDIEDVEFDTNFPQAGGSYFGKFCVVVNKGDYRKDRMVSTYVQNTVLANGKAVDSMVMLDKCAEIIGSDVVVFRKYSGVIL